MASLKPPRSSSLPLVSSPTLQIGPKIQHITLASEFRWSIKFIPRSTDLNHRLPSQSVSLVAHRGSAQWHVRVTFLGEPCRTVQESRQTTTDWPKRWRDFKAICRCIDFDPHSLLDDKFTELLILPEPDPSFSVQLLRLKELPSIDSDYAAFRNSSLWFHAREYPKHPHYPRYTGSGRTVHLRNIIRLEDIDSFQHVYIARILGDERQYVYKGVDRLIYNPSESKAIEQELRNLELFQSSQRIVRLAAAVVSRCPYQTRETGAPPVLRGVLLEYHPNGTLHDVLQFPEHWMHSSSWWLQWALDISMGLVYMHQKGVTHMDLKPTNVVMSKEWNAVIIDVSGIGGTSDDWLLPELFESLDRCSQSWALRVRSDTWALGKILASMAKAINDDGNEEKSLLLQISKEIEQSRGCTPLAGISNRISLRLAV